MNRLLVISWVVAVLAGCAGPEDLSDRTLYGPGASPSQQQDSRWVRKYHPFLLHMSDGERIQFDRLAGDSQRETFLVRHGIKIRRRLNQSLREGMISAQVLPLLGRPHRTFVETDDEVRVVTWHYSEFNGFGRTRYELVFREDRLSGWQVYTVEGGN